jgi:hypothetical protein
MSTLPSYKLDPAAAREVGVSKWITETGKYKGKIISAHAITAATKSQGIQIAFESDEGQRAERLQLWLADKTDKPLHGSKVLSAIMTCLKLRELKAESSKKSEHPVFPALEDKRIGFLLEAEPYHAGNRVLTNMVLVAPFVADTEQTAAEVLDGKSAGGLPAMVSRLRDRPLRERAERGNSGHPAAPPPPSADDDVPF